MLDELKQLFRTHDPQIELISYSNNEATFQLRDCDHYRLGKFVCNDVRVICLTTQSAAYSEINIYNFENLSDQLAIFKEVLDKNYHLITFQLEDLADFSPLPQFNQVPVGYIICKAINYLAETNPGRD